MTKPAEKYSRHILFILALIVAVRLVVIIHLSSIPLFYDQVWYNEDAVKYLHGEKWVPQWPPGLPLFLAGVYKIFGQSDLVAHIGIFILGLVSLLLIYVLSRKIGLEQGPAIAAVMLIGLLPGSFYYTGLPVTQTPAAVLLLLIALMLIGDQERDGGSLFYLGMASLFLGLLTLVRAGGIFIFPVLLSFSIYKRRKARFARLSIASLPFLAVVAIWTYYLWTISGGFVFINTYNTYNLFIGNNQYTHFYNTWEELSKPDMYLKAISLIPGLENMGVAQQEHAYFKAAFDYCASRPDLFLVRFVSRALCFWSFDTNAASTVLRLGLLPHKWAVVYMVADSLANLLVIFMVFMSLIFYRYEKKALVLLLLSLGYMSQFLIAFSHPSYHYPVLALLAPPAGYTLLSIRSLGIKEGWRSIRGHRFGLATLILFCVIQGLWVVFMLDRFKYLK